jgi:hypothetical protein
MENEEKKPDSLFSDDETSEDKETDSDQKDGSYTARRIDFRFELALFLILGFLLGVVIKTEAVKRITIGFNDSSVPSYKQAYDFEKIKEDVANQDANTAPQGQPEQAAPSDQPPTDSQNNPAQGN